VGAELFHVDGRTDMTDRQTDKAKLIVTFRNFGSMPKKQNAITAMLFYMLEKL